MDTRNDMMGLGKDDSFKIQPVLASFCGKFLGPEKVTACSPEKKVPIGKGKNMDPNLPIVGFHVSFWVVNGEMNENGIQFDKQIYCGGQVVKKKHRPAGLVAQEVLRHPL